MRLHASKLTVLLCLLIAVALTACGGAQERKAKYMTRGKSYFEEQNYEKAAVEFKNVLQIDPKTPDPYYYLGQIAEKNGDLRQAYANYSKAVDLNPRHFEARIKLAKIYTFVGDAKKAGAIVEDLLKKTPPDPRVLSLKAEVLYLQGDENGAMKLAGEIVTAHPEQIEATALLSGLYAKRGDTGNALKVLQQGIAASPKDVSLRLQIINLYQAMNLPDKLIQSWQELSGLKPDNLEYRANLAKTYAGSRQVDKGEAILRSAVQEKPDDVKRRLLLAEYLANYRGVSNAEEELKSAIKDHPKGYELRFTLAALYELAHQYDKAEAEYRATISLARTEPDGLKARDRLANMFLGLGKVPEAEALMNEVLKESPHDNNALVLQGRIALANNNPQNAINSFRTALKDKPDSVDLLTFLAAAHNQNNEPLLAKQSLQRAIDADRSNPKPKLLMAEQLLREKDQDGAAKLIDEALSAAPTDLNALEMKAQLLAAQNNTAELEGVLKKIRDAYPTRPDGYMGLAKLYLAQQKPDAALRELEQAYEKSADKSQPISMIVSIYVTQKKFDQAIGRLNQAVSQNPKDPVLFNLLGDVYSQQGKTAEAGTAFETAIEKNPAWTVPYMGLGNLYLRTNDVKSALQIYKKGFDAVPGDLRLGSGLSELYLRTGDKEAALPVLEQMLRKNPGNPVAANNLAAFLADYTHDAQSLKRALELAAPLAATNQPGFLDTLGWVYYRRGEVDKALPLLEKATGSAPRSGELNYHLGMAYQKLGKNAQARASLTKAVASGEKFTGLDEAQSTLRALGK